MTPTTTPLADWLEAAGSREATPGGGSVAAVAGALAAAMGEMTLRFSRGRKSNTPADEAAVAEAVGRLEASRRLLLRLCEEDQSAYAAWRATRDLPADHPDRRAAVEAATGVPRAVMAACLAVLDAANVVAGVANPWLLSDLRVCGDLATAGVRAASYNVLANLGDAGEAEAVELRGECAGSVAEAVKRVRALDDAISSR